MDDRGPPENRIEQVRELMFGPQLRDCNNKIEQLESLFTRSRDDNQRHFAEIRELLSQEVTGAATAADKRAKALDLKAGEGLAELRTRLEEVEERWSGRFQAFEQSLANAQEDARKRVEAAQEALSSSLRASVETIEKRLQAMSNELQMQCGDLRRQGKRTDERLESRAQSIGEEIESGAGRLRAELGQVERGLRDGIQRLEMQLSSELRKSFDDVRFSKVSKDEISEILVEFGMRLKGVAANAARFVSLDAPERNK